MGNIDLKRDSYQEVFLEKDDVKLSRYFRKLLRTLFLRKSRPVIFEKRCKGLQNLTNSGLSQLAQLKTWLNFALMAIDVLDSPQIISLSDPSKMSAGKYSF